MKPTFILSLALLTATVSAPKVTAQIISNDFVQKGSAQLSADDKAYNDGQTALNESRWSDALAKFDQVIRGKGARADAATYWKAFSLNKLGRPDEALRTIGELRQQFPKSRWLNDARALEIDIRPNQQVGNNPPTGSTATGACGDEELKLLALNRLMDRDEERAVPLLERFLQNQNCKRLRERALFVLGQSENPKAIDMITRIAKGELYPELQTKAIHQIGIVNANDRNMKTLAQIYSTTTNYDVKRTILHTYGVNGSKELLMQAVRGEKDPKLQKDAIQGLGISGARNELRQLYKELPGYEAKSAVLNAFIVSGDSEGFEDVARTETDPKLQKQAIRGIGISGGRNAGPALVEIYQKSNNADVKKAALEGLFVSDNAKSLVALARGEKDPEMKKRIVERLSVMDNKEATDYMIEILDKQ
jgi:HEAT repeat protein